ncbi:MAG: pantoate--beta-alanine ligase [Deltaproteobacteria bacterium]|nr:pantoate--beta-alanine ligase [Deltaproteobacteria bacterium]
MKVIQSISEWKALRPTFQGRVSLIPTMGFLHEGHLSLVRRARQETEVVIVWIFVNPKQFGPREDFEKYPRNMERDLDLLRPEGVDYVFAPTVEGVYPPGFQTTVSVEKVTQSLEGALRPGHFTGVATVVAKMLCLTQPQRAYFGQKDGQQCLVVKRMVEDLGLLTEIVVCPTVRDADGLALSSRNVYLNPEERQVAPLIYRALTEAQAAAEAGECDAEVLRGLMRAVLSQAPALSLEYASVADALTLEECTRLEGPVLISIAARLGRTRLIDNVLLSGPHGTSS